MTVWEWLKTGLEVTDVETMVDVNLDMRKVKHAVKRGRKSRYEVLLSCNQQRVGDECHFSVAGGFYYRNERCCVVSVEVRCAHSVLLSDEQPFSLCSIWKLQGMLWFHSRVQAALCYAYAS